MADAPCIALVAGEASGDLLGAALIAALREQRADLTFVGVAGPRMRAAGCEAIADSDELAVMGLTEVLRHLPRLLRLRRRLREALRARHPAVFIGIDAPEFNLGLAGWLKARGVATVQYVSPQVWAWRQGRVRHIGQAVDRVLCLLPFEVDFYARHAVDARFVGHPLADQIPLVVDRAGARAALGLPLDRTVVALLPGSRLGEVERLGLDFARTAALLASQRSPQPLFVAPMANARVRAVFEAQVREAGASVRLVEGRSQQVLASADVVLVASGTATLETLLTQRPMVVAYRLGAITAFLLRTLGLVKVRHFAQPNLLAGEGVVPEFFQEQVTPDNLARAVAAWLDDPAAAVALSRRFAAIHLQLRQDGARAAARAILELLDRR
jgi:lipid-A-disaccharide synthase